MVSCTQKHEIIYWDLNLKASKNIINIFDDEHENVIDVVVFAPMKTAKTIIENMQTNMPDGQAGDNDGDEESKGEDDPNNGDKVKEENATKLAKKAEELKRLREKMAALKKGTTSKTKDEEEDKKEDQSDEIQVKDEFVASG